MEREYVVSEAGRGIPLVMLHGVVGCAKHWRGVMPYLPNNCRGIALTFPFFDDDNPVSSVDAAVGYVRRFLDNIGEKQVVLMGNSFGGHVALQLALSMPGQVSGLVLTGSSGLLERSFGTPPSARPDREWVRQATLSVFHNESIVTEEMIDDICMMLGCRTRVRRLVELFRSTRGERLDARLKEINCPVQLIWGRQDKITPPGTALEFHSLLPDSELCWIENCGHVPMLDAPQQFVLHLRQWWNRRMRSTAWPLEQHEERLPA